MRAPTNVKFYWVDVFATEPLEGNPLPVVVDADALDEATIKRITREFNQVETTFVLKPSRAGATYRLRSFTVPGQASPRKSFRPALIAEGVLRI